MKQLLNPISNVHGKMRVGLIIAVPVLIILFLFPKMVSHPYMLHLMILFFLSTIMGESWNILGGYTGQYSVGHAAYFGTGAYVTMMLMQYRQVPPWYGMWAGMAVRSGE